MDSSIYLFISGKKAPTLPTINEEYLVKINDTIKYITIQPLEEIIIIK
jgi:hypothetical protein